MARSYCVQIFRVKMVFPDGLSLYSSLCVYHIDSCQCRPVKLHENPKQIATQMLFICPFEKTGRIMLRGMASVRP